MQVPSEEEEPSLLDYLIVGGLVFLTLSDPYLRETFGEKWRDRLCSGLGELRHAPDGAEQVS